MDEHRHHDHFDPEDPFILGDVCKPPHREPAESGFVMHHIFLIGPLFFVAVFGIAYYFIKQGY